MASIKSTTSQRGRSGGVRPCRLQQIENCPLHGVGGLLACGVVPQGVGDTCPYQKVVRYATTAAVSFTILRHVSEPQRVPCRRVSLVYFARHCSPVNSPELPSRGSETAPEAGRTTLATCEGREQRFARWDPLLVCWGRTGYRGRDGFVRWCADWCADGWMDVGRLFVWQGSRGYGSGSMLVCLF